MTHLTSILRSAILRLADVPQRALSKVSVQLGPRVVRAPASVPPPAHVTLRLEDVFEELSELPFQPHVAAALELACDALQAQLPTEAVVAGLYDIDADEIRFVTTRGTNHEQLRGTALPRVRCLVGPAEHEAIITSGDASGVDWIGCGEGSTLLLCPILHDGTLLGALALADPLCTASFSRHDVDLIHYVAEQLAIFIDAQRHRSRNQTRDLVG